MSQINAQLVDDVQERAIDELLELNLAALEAADGIGNSALDRSERLARFAEYASDGTLDVLRGMNAPAYDHLVAEYNRDIKAELEAANGR